MDGFQFHVYCITGTNLEDASLVIWPRSVLIQTNNCLQTNNHLTKLAQGGLHQLLLHTKDTSKLIRPKTALPFIIARSITWCDNWLQFVLDILPLVRFLIQRGFNQSKKIIQSLDCLSSQWDLSAGMIIDFNLSWTYLTDSKLQIQSKLKPTNTPSSASASK